LKYLHEFVRSLRRAPRRLLRTPAITMASIATLAIALGATTAIFSVLYGIVLRPLPFRDPNMLVQINARAEDGRLLGMSQVELEDWVSQSSSFESIALYGFNQFTLTGVGDPSMLRGAIVSKQFCSLLSVPIRLGRELWRRGQWCAACRACGTDLARSLW
jgi:putative ABC transport system permease protein